MTDSKVIGRIVLKGRLVLASPLLIGAGANDNFTDLLVLKNKAGNPYIPGTSLAGVLRSLAGACEKYFGALDTMQSCITTADVELENSKLVIRDSVAIDPVRGVGLDGSKFDYELVERGAEGDFELVATIRQFQKDEFAVIRQFMETIGKQLLQGIFIGAKTTNGFGKVKAKKDSVQLHTYDYSKYADVKAWLQQDSAANCQVIKAETVAKAEDFVIEGSFALKSSLLVRSTDFEDKDYEECSSGEKISAVQMRSRKDYVIPGATLKGVVRNQAYHICQALGKPAEDLLQEIFGSANDNGGKKTGYKGRLIAEETYIKEKGDVHDHPQTRNKIDRFTGATVDSALFTNIPVWQNKADQPSVELRLVLKSYKPWEAGLLLFVLKDLWTGQVAIGGEKSIGRGTLSGINGKLLFAGHTVNIRDFGGFEVDNPQALEALAQAFVDYAG